MSRIAIIGARGVNLPGVSFGGFETFITGLAPRLVARGHEVIVYSRKGLYRTRPAVSEGVRLRWLPALEGKVMGTPSHTLLAMLDAVVHRYDSILVVNPGMGFHCVIPRLLSGSWLAMNVDGVEWERGKWGRFGRWYFKRASWASTKLCHVIVADSEGMQDLYRREFGVDSIFVPYAFDPVNIPDDGAVRSLGVTRGGYFLVVGRMIPENNIDFICDEFAAARTQRPLIVVGGTNYDSSFHRQLAEKAGDRVRFIGHIDDMNLLWALYANAYAYVHGHSVGGTNPALLQALATGICPVIYDVVFNREVAGPAGVTFDKTPGALARIVEELEARPDDVTRRGALARERLLERYTWDRVVDGYETALDPDRAIRALDRSAKTAEAIPRLDSA